MEDIEELFSFMNILFDSVFGKFSQSILFYIFCLFVFVFVIRILKFILSSVKV